ncbi:formate dehydrogenase subunit beta [Massilia oculi]|jgi:formate dehydrogenase iron-sulfur subunit|uniref:Formate dehydrogenase subunit beta n=1 Tax=Massilia oculi TaxID=945844 RepID=A0A2S2DDE7_9BURK|nr:formate dehydrogenase subunit beta [Massilia oculi]AWL03129.1 formate dehydrogenase subunit beta [Massilia oculi]
MSSLQSLDIAKRSATTATTPVARTHKAEVAKLIDVSSCIGCKACQVACMQWNDLRDDIGETHGTYDNPRDLTPQSWTVMKYSEVVTQTPDEGDRLEWLIRKDGCMHCDEPGCLKACPAPGAIVKYTNGIVDFISENCIGCGYCVAGCPFDVPRISKVDSKAYKCSLCADRVAVNMEPACVKICPTGAIRFGTKEDMIEYAGDRVVDLKERGYQNAGLYNPAGVGGTHVMYVLQHADKPNLYAGLPENPTISPTVALWKGVAKPLGVAAMIGAAVAGFFHYMKVGPIETHVDEPPVQPTPDADQRDAVRDEPRV